MSTVHAQSVMPIESQPRSSTSDTGHQNPETKQINDLESHFRGMIVENKLSNLGDSQSQIQNPTQMMVSSNENTNTTPSQGLPKTSTNIHGLQGSRQTSSSPTPSRPPLADKQAFPLSTAAQRQSQINNIPQEKNISLSQTAVNQGQKVSHNQQVNRPKQPTQPRDVPRQGHQNPQPSHQAALPNHLNPRNTVQPSSRPLRHDQQNNLSNQTRQGQQFPRGRQTRNQMTATPNQGSSDNLSHPRPAPNNRQLFNPGQNGTLSTYQNRSHPHASAFEGPTDFQVEFLKKLSSVEIPKAEMTLEELEEKEALRLKLQEICRDSIFKYECARDENFRRNSVALKCFGSLSSGFATKSSDMDLALVSPHSIPDASSAESEIPRLLEKALLESGYGARLLTQTRVPIIKFCEKPTPELAEALHHEREKFEKQRDALSKLAAEKREDQSGQVIPQVKNHQDENDTGAAKSMNVGDDKVTGNPIPRPDQELVFLYKLAIKEGWYNESERKIIYEFVQAVEKKDTADDSDVIDKARLSLNSLPDVLSKYRPPPDKDLDFPKNGVGIQCDINFSNPLALHNTRLLRCYALCDHRVRPLVLFVKAWAKRRKINSPYRGTLSSYGYVLMVLHYLANVVDPPIIPNLQTTRKAWQDISPENAVLVDGYNVRFWRSEKEIKDHARRGMLTRNTTDGLGILICGFFHYYAHQGKFSPAGGFSWTNDVISLRTQGGLLRKQTKDWVGAKTVVESAGPGQQPREIRHRYLLAIEDPFELQHNIARTVIHPGIVSIRNEFRRAIVIIQSVGPAGAKVVDLFAEGRESILPPRKAFGPLPRTDHPDANGTGGPKDAEINKPSRNGTVPPTGPELVAETNRPGDSRRQNGSRYSKRRVPMGRNGPTPASVPSTSSNPSFSRPPSPLSSGIGA